MKRTVMEKLLAWKNKAHRKPLLVTGVRQCGKTYLIRQFGAEAFEDCAYFNFDGDDGLRSVFAYDFHIPRILDELGSTVLGRRIIPGKTLVVFDEIQACPRAIMALKYFCEEMPELHVIAAGSLLGVALREENISFPVGKVERLEMYPMSFEEFVMADGGAHLLDGLTRIPVGRELSTLYTVPMEKYYRNYLIVGGMPEAVQAWVDTHDYHGAEEVQDRILKDYADDFAKHASADIATKIRLIWDAIPTQIARENNKFIFSHVKSGARAKELEDALAWLVNAGIVCRLHLVTEPELPLSGMADATYFKVYLADVGLLRRKARVNYRTILNGDEAYAHFKGALAENYVLLQLKHLGIEGYFWRTKADAEVDYLTDYEGILLPIEVKAADNTKAKSLHLFCSRYAPQMAVRTSMRNVGDNRDGATHVYSIPLYQLYRLREYVAAEMGW